MSLRSGRLEDRRRALFPQPLVGPRVGVLAVRARRRQLLADLEGVVAEPVVDGKGVVPLRRLGRLLVRRFDVPGERRRGRTDDLVAAGPGQEAPPHAGVGRRVVERRRVGEDLPGRVVLAVVDQVLADEHATVAAVHVRGEAHRLGIVPADQHDLVRSACGALWHGYGDQLDRLHSGLVDTRVFGGDLCGLVGRQRRRRRPAGVASKRRAHVPDGAVAHSDDEQPVTAGCKAAEPLPEQHRGALTQRGDTQDLECRSAARGEPEQVAVGGDVCLSGRHRVGGQAGGERLTGRRKHRGCAEVVPAGPGTNLIRLGLLAGGGRGPALSIVLVLGLDLVSWEPPGFSGAPVLPAGRCDAARSGCEDERRCDQRGGPRVSTGWCAHSPSPPRRLRRRRLDYVEDCSLSRAL